MITLDELLDDKRYREYFLRVPKLPHIERIHPPWRLYVQRDSGSPWSRKDFETYREAYLFYKSRYKNVSHDASITSRAHAFYPPVRIVKLTRAGVPLLDKNGIQQTKEVFWRVSLPDDEIPHRWCPYCRRPTIFTWFSKHHAFPKGAPMDPSQVRCTICGVSERAIESYGS